MKSIPRGGAILVVLALALTTCTPAAPSPTAAPPRPEPTQVPAAKPGTSPAAKPAASPAAKPVASPAAKPDPKPSGPPVAFKFRTPFVPALSYSAFYVAQELFWPQLNLNGEALPGTGSLAAVQTVAAGSEQMGYTAIASALPAISQGAPVSIIAVIQRRDPAGLTFLKESGIQTIKDIEGKTVGNFPAGTTGPLVRVALKRAGVDESKVRFVNVSPGGEVTLLLQRQIDAQAGFAGGQDVRIRCEGVETGAIPVAQFGVDVYGQGVIVNTNWMREVGDEVVVRALLGIVRAAKVVKADTDKALDILIKLNPQRPLDRAQELASASRKGFVRLSEDTGSEVLKRHGYGWIDAAEMERTQDLLVEAGLIEARADPARVFTTKYLEDPRVEAAAKEWVQTPWAEPPADIKEKCGL